MPSWGIHLGIANKLSQKIENIIRDEMNKLDGQEVLFPVALPGSLWEESGRYESVGSELLRFTDRTGSKMVLGMTHEEASVQLVREYANSYAKYPFMIYQFQTKFRDEARPRAGLIRVREFTMKDAYSFHTSQEDLERYYQICYNAYNRIFARAGIPEVVTVASDSGMMGGSLSHEYMLLTPIGEDSIAICSDCDYRANMEAVATVVQQQLAEIGVTVNIESCDTSTFFPRFFASKDKELATTWDLGTNGWDSQRGSNCGQAISYFTNRLCDCGYSDEVSGLAQKAIGTADAKEKQELWNTIQDKALEECWEYPLTYTNFVMVSQKNVTGLDGSSVVPEFIDYLSIHVD